MEAMDGSPQRLDLLKKPKPIENAQSRWLHEQACSNGFERRGALENRDLMAGTGEKNRGGLAGGAATDNPNTRMTPWSAVMLVRSM